MVTLTSITSFWIHSLCWMCILALAICTIDAINGIFIPCSKRGAVGVGLLLTLLAITKTFKSALTAVLATVAGFIWFLLYGTFAIIRDLVINKA